MASHLVVRACPPFGVPGDAGRRFRTGGGNRSGCPGLGPAAGTRLAFPAGHGRARACPGHDRADPAGLPCRAARAAAVRRRSARRSGVGPHCLVQLPTVRHRREHLTRPPRLPAAGRGRAAAAEPVPRGRLDPLGRGRRSGSGPAPGHRRRGSGPGGLRWIRRRRADPGGTTAPRRAGRHLPAARPGAAVGAQGGVAQDAGHGAADGPGHPRRAGLGAWTAKPGCGT